MSNKISISKIEIKNYRSCLKTIFEPDKNLSALIGVNASGKSNILNSILLLKKLGRYRRHFDEERYIINRSNLNVLFSIGKKSIRYKAIINYNTDERNRDEVLSTQEKWNFKELTGKNKWYEIPLSFWRRDMNIQFLSKERFLLTDNYGKFFRISLEEASLLNRYKNVFKDITDFINSLTYYSASQFTDPSKCPASLEINDEGGLSRLTQRRQEHTQFIYDLYQSYKKGSKNYDEFLSLVGKNGINLIDSIKFNEVSVPSRVVEVKTGGRIIKKVRKTLVVIPSFVIRKIKLSPNQLSEGTFKTLAIIFYLITDKSKLLLLEEPEVCIHHGLLASIIELIKTFSTRKQIIVSTHSDYILDMLEPSNVFLVQNLSEKGTIVKSIPKTLSSSNYKALKHYLNKSGNLGEYWRHGGFE